MGGKGGGSGIGNALKVQGDALNMAQKTMSEAFTKAEEQATNPESANQLSAINSGISNSLGRVSDTFNTGGSMLGGGYSNMRAGPGSMGRPSINPVSDWNQTDPSYIDTDNLLPTMPRTLGPESLRGQGPGLDGGSFGGKPVGGARAAIHREQTKNRNNQSGGK